MGAIERFEDWLHGLFEGSLPALLGGQIHPVDVARRLVDQMADSTLVSAGRVYAPTAYRAYMSPRALAVFAPFQHALEEELATTVRERGAESGYHFVGAVRVELRADPELGAGQLRVEADVDDRREGGDGSQGTRPIRITPAAGPVAPARVALVVGKRRFPLPQRVLAVGRALDNDVILDDATVSRHHARLTPRGGFWMLEDLGSTHGVLVNDRRVSTSCMVRAGDRLTFGRVAARLDGEAGPPP